MNGILIVEENIDGTKVCKKIVSDAEIKYGKIDMYELMVTGKAICITSKFKLLHIFATHVEECDHELVLSSVKILPKNRLWINIIRVILNMNIYLRAKDISIDGKSIL